MVFSTCGRVKGVFSKGKSLLERPFYRMTMRLYACSESPFDFPTLKLDYHHMHDVLAEPLAPLYFPLFTSFTDEWNRNHNLLKWISLSLVCLGFFLFQEMHLLKVQSQSASYYSYDPITHSTLKMVSAVQNPELSPSICVCMCVPEGAKKMKNPKCSALEPTRISSGPFNLNLRGKKWERKRRDERAMCTQHEYVYVSASRVEKHTDFGLASMGRHTGGNHKKLLRDISSQLLFISLSCPFNSRTRSH